VVLSLLLLAGMLDSTAVELDTLDVEPDTSEVEIRAADATEAEADTSKVTAEVVESPWAFSGSMTSYFGSTIDLYAVPDLWIEYHGFHLEARYNYEDLHTGSMFLGWHFGWGDENSGLDATPMVGWVVGRIDGVAPALLIDARLGRFALYNELEYVFPQDDESFAYDRTDLMYAFAEPMFLGIAGEHTLSSSDRDFVPGLLIGASAPRFVVTFYVFQPGDNEAKGAMEFELEY
jgi:hypothetical protein